MDLLTLIINIGFLGFFIFMMFIDIKGKDHFELHPTVAIFWGLLAMVNSFDFSLYATSGNNMLLSIAIGTFVGGFIASFFSRRNKIFMGFLEGIFFSIFILSLILIYGSHHSLNDVYGIAIPLISAGLGGFIAIKFKKFIMPKWASNIIGYDYCISEYSNFQCRYNQLSKGENDFVPELIRDCEDLVSKFNSIKDLGISDEINKSIIVGNLQNILIDLKKISILKIVL